MWSRETNSGELSLLPQCRSPARCCWNYTCKTWGEAQAEKYISGLHVYIQQLADRAIAWRPLPSQFIVPVDLDIEVYFGHYQKHYIFFKEIHEGSIGIMAIFHESMDIPVRLGLDLNSMQ